MSAERLLTWAIQTLALMALAGLVVRLPVCQVRAAARSAAWSATLALCAGLMVWPWFEAAGNPGAGPAGPGVAVAAAFSPFVVPEPVGRLWPWFTRVWMAGAASALALVARDVVRVVRLKRRARPVSQAAFERLGALTTLVTSSRNASVCWCDDLDSPAVLGFTRPIIALPRSQAACLSDEQLQHVVLHELAHVRRRDDWWALAEHVIAAVTWMNPAIHLVRHQAEVAREMACDAWAVRRALSPAAYARGLTEVAGLRSRARRLRFAAAVTGRPGMLRRRIMSVLAFDSRPPARAVAGLAWLAPVAVCVAAVGLVRLPPVFIVAQTPAAAMTEVLGAAAEGASTPVSAARQPAGTESVRAPVGGRRAARAARVAQAPRPSAQVEIDPGQPAQVPAPTLATMGSETMRSEPLTATPLPAAGAVGMAAASYAPGTVPAGSAPRSAWWSGPREFGEATGGAAATAGRATASFVMRVGSSVPKLFAE
jgi:Zn-dependent protease with chaperone function